MRSSDHPVRRRTAVRDLTSSRLARIARPKITTLPPVPTTLVREQCRSDKIGTDRCRACSPQSHTPGKSFPQRDTLLAHPRPHTRPHTRPQKRHAPQRLIPQHALSYPDSPRQKLDLPILLQLRSHCVDSASPKWLAISERLRATLFQVWHVAASGPR